jgi:sugar lactone lactonase YvrE
MNRTGRPPEIPPQPTAVSCVMRDDDVVMESPLWCPVTRRLLAVGIRHKLVHILDPATGRSQTHHLPELVTSVATRAQGGLILTLRKTFAFFDPDTGRLEPLFDPEPARPANRFNDAKCDRQGRLWAGTMGERDWQADSGALYRLTPDLTATRMHDRVICSNGTGWSPDGRTLYHTESFRYAIFAYDFEPAAGTLANRRPFATLDPTAAGFPDGLTVDAEGHVWSAQPGYGRLVRYDPTGRIERIVEMPVSRPTSCIFGGDAYDVLYITTARETLTPEQLAEEPLAGSLLTIRPGVRGLAETPFAG